MADNAKKAFDKGYADGTKKAEADRNSSTVATAIGEFISSSYRGDSNFPESYREGFKQGKKNS
ncbi:MAG: hypothetical protein ABII89_07695 [Candidatus Omnitrophota bacterium]